jgi:hypothetical protein
MSRARMSKVHQGIEIRGRCNEAAARRRVFGDDVENFIVPGRGGRMSHCW